MQVNVDNASVGGWHKLQLELSSENSVARLNESSLIVAALGDLSSARIGLVSEMSRVDYRNLDVTNRQGAKLLNGFAK